MLEENTSEAPPPSTIEQLTAEQVKMLVEMGLDDRLSTLDARTGALEERLAPESLIQHIATTNEAVLAKGLDRLEDDVRAVQKNALTKWDVATVVFAILGALGVLIGVVFAIINFASK